MRDLIIGSAGHIDHGKTTLIKTLTGIDPDRLAEEQRRGITIDIGFAHLDLGDFRVGFIDVPGHEKFVKNMLAGIGGIDFVLMVVAADESVMPQTVEHFQICKLLNLRAGLIVLTKADLVDEELLELVEVEVRELVDGSFLESAPVIGVDSVSGRGLDQLRQTLESECHRLFDNSARAQGTLFRLPIDRVFTLRGFGTIVTGTPWTGTLQKETPVEVHPAGLAARVRGIQVFGETVEGAGAGQRTALNLAGIDTSDLTRGMVLTRPGEFLPSYMFDLSLELLADAPGPLKHRSPARFHHGSSELIGRVYLLDRAQLEPGDSCLAQIRLDTPTVACPGDRFILRRYSPLVTIAGGTILDNAPPKHRRKTQSSQLPRLERLSGSLAATEGPAELLRFIVEGSGPSGITVRDLSARTGLEGAVVERVISADASVRLIASKPALAVWSLTFTLLLEQLCDFLSEFHTKNPLAAGATREQIQRRLRNVRPLVFDHLLEELKTSQRITVSATSICLFGQSVELTEEQQILRSTILDLFVPGVVENPSPGELPSAIGISSKAVESIFYLLIEEGTLLRVSKDMVLSRSQYDWLVEELRGAFPESAFTVGNFKELINVTRKYAIPLLEFLDRQKVTRRAADKRVLAKPL